MNSYFPECLKEDGGNSNPVLDIISDAIWNFIDDYGDSDSYSNLFKSICKLYDKLQSSVRQCGVDKASSMLKSAIRKFLRIAFSGSYSVYNIVTNVSKLKENLSEAWYWYKNDRDSPYYINVGWHVALAVLIVIQG